MARKPSLNSEQKEQLKYIVEQEMKIYETYRDNQKEWGQTKGYDEDIFKARLTIAENLGKRIFGGVSNTSIDRYLKKLIPEIYGKRKSILYSQSKYGKTRSEETKRKISEANTGKTLSEEHKRKLYEANIGRTHSEEARRKMSEALKGKYAGKTLSEEHKRKISEANTGKTFSKEHKRKMSEARKGKYTGENHPRWKGGTSALPYSPEFKWVMRKYIRERDNHECQFCETPENGISHAVHHIDHNKENDSEFNLISMCMDCHNNETTSNSDQPIWQEILTEKIQEIYEEMTEERKIELQDLRGSLESRVVGAA
tara:strand:+ start:433 stop:1371 length:939 start_codon:yes stop_codon:yes gene_type:complete